jgi:thiol-disulfide isomerase/thioredoxin
MKKLFYLFLLVTASSFTTPKETIIISGKILNSESGKITLRRNSTEKEITLKKDGTFSESIEMENDGKYVFSSGKNWTKIYLAPDSKLEIFADDTDFHKTLKFSGNGNVENQYIADKNLTIKNIDQKEIYLLDENTFINKVKEIMLNLKNNFKKTKFTQKGFIEPETKNLYFQEQVYYMNYESNHAYHSKIEDFKVSDKFPKLDQNINLDDEAAFQFSDSYSYSQLIGEQFRKKIDLLMGGKDDYTDVVAIPEIEKLKSQSIKNALCGNLYYEITLSNPNCDYLYNSLLSLSTDTKFKEKVKVKYDKLKTLKAGTTSTGFDYENHKGGTTSLESLKGKYVYIDVWATWCGPCRKEIPSLKKIEESYHGKNIEFVSISVDALKDHEKWSKMVTEKELGGIQLFANDSWKSQFCVDYIIESIPRFIIIDPNGKIVNADAPRPSEEKLITLLNSLPL